MNISGNREDVLEIIIDIKHLESYGLIFNKALELFAKVPGFIEDLQNLMDFPSK